jgi:hypothetical protein
MTIFNSYVKLPEGTYITSPVRPALSAPLPDECVHAETIQQLGTKLAFLRVAWDVEKGNERDMYCP